MSRFCIASMLLVATVVMGCKYQKVPPEVDIELTTTTPVIKADQAPLLSVSLVNCGKRSVTLVQPGDGSSVGWRTPIISWSVINTDDPLMPRTEEILLRCGNINSLNKDEVFMIAPGEKIQLNSGWVQPQFLLQPGIYEVSFNYLNVPKLKWSGVPLGKHDRSAMRRIRNSTPFEGTSNTVTIVVVDPLKNEDSE